MQQNSRDQQERRDQQQTTEQPEQEGEQNSAPVSSQVEQQSTEECMELLRRTQADFVNYRRRMSQEQAEGRITAQIALLSRLLPALDDLGRALGTAPPELATNPWGQGLLLVARRLTTLLDQLGVRQIGAPGEPFDPYLHEAISTEARSDVPEGTILRVAGPGYVLGDRVIRPAQVTVARAWSPASQAPGRPGQHGDAATR